MNSAIRIDNQNQLDELCQFINWDEAFIREAYMVSPTYKTEAGLSLVGFGGRPDLRMLVITPHDKNIAGIEIILQGIENISIDVGIEFRLSGKVSPHNTSVELCFDESQTKNITAERAFYVTRDTEINGYKLRYGLENPFTGSGHRPF